MDPPEDVVPLARNQYMFAPTGMMRIRSAARPNVSMSLCFAISEWAKTTRAMRSADEPELV